MSDGQSEREAIVTRIAELEGQHLALRGELNAASERARFYRDRLEEPFLEMVKRLGVSRDEASKRRYGDKRTLRETQAERQKIEAEMGAISLEMKELRRRLMVLRAKPKHFVSSDPLGRSIELLQLGRRAVRDAYDAFAGAELTDQQKIALESLMDFSRLARNLVRSSRGYAGLELDDSEPVGLPTGAGSVPS